MSYVAFGQSSYVPPTGGLYDYPQTPGGVPSGGMEDYPGYDAPPSPGTYQASSNTTEDEASSWSIIGAGLLVPILFFL